MRQKRSKFAQFKDNPNVLFQRDAQSCAALVWPGPDPATAHWTLARPWAIRKTS